jgi:hypothetical protein
MAFSTSVHASSARELTAEAQRTQRKAKQRRKEELLAGRDIALLFVYILDSFSVSLCSLCLGG